MCPQNSALAEDRRIATGTAARKLLDQNVVLWYTFMPETDEGVAMAGTARLGVLCITIAVALAGGATLAAHHSFAMFDTANPVTLEGVVTSIEWTNPHAYIEVDVPDGRGGQKHWSIELGSPSILMRGGWKFNTVRRGDKVSAVVSPLRNGDAGCLLNRIALPDGRVLSNGGGPPARGVASPR